jgi:hypothetical protein
VGMELVCVFRTTVVVSATEDQAWVYRRWHGANIVTESTELPYTCSVCTVVWEEGHREVSPYPD